MEKKSLIKLSKSQPAMNLVLLMGFLAFQGFIILFLSGNITIFRLVGYYIETNGFLLLGIGSICYLIFHPQRNWRHLLRVVVFFCICGVLLLLGKWFQSQDQTPSYYGFENIFVSNYMFGGLSWICMIFLIQKSSIIYDPLTGDLLYRKDRFTQIKEKQINLNAISHIIIINYGAKAEIIDLKKKKGWQNLSVEKLSTYTSKLVHMKIYFFSDSDTSKDRCWNLGAKIDSTTVFYKLLPIFYQYHQKVGVFGKVPLHFADTTKGRQALTGNGLGDQNLDDIITEYVQQRNLILPSMVPTENRANEIFQESHSSLQLQVAPTGYIIDYPIRALQRKFLKVLYLLILIISIFMIVIVFLLILNLINYIIPNFPIILQDPREDSSEPIGYLVYVFYAFFAIILGIVSFYGLFSHVHFQIQNDRMIITQIIGKKEIVSITMPIAYITDLHFEEISRNNQERVKITMDLLGGKEILLWDGDISFLPEILKFYQNKLTMNGKVSLE